MKNIPGKRFVKLFCSGLVLLLTTSHAFSQSPDWLWAKSFEGAPLVSVVDDNGNLYIGGGNHTQLTIDTNNIPNHGNLDFYIVKLDPQGNVLWVKSFGGNNWDILSCMAVDNDGNLLLGGCFYSDTLQLDSILLINTNLAGTTNDLFIVKLDSGGNVMWAKSAGSSSFESVTTMIVDQDNNLFATGGFTGPSLTFGNTTLSNSPFLSMFLIKADSLGNYLWAKGAQGISSQDIIVDNLSNIYLTGTFSDTVVSFDSITIFAPDTVSKKTFTTKYDSSGHAIWAKYGASIVPNGTACLISIALDKSGYLYELGTYRYPYIVFDSDTLRNESLAASEVFFVKYDTSGNVIWSRTTSGNAGAGNGDITTDNHGNIYILGSFGGDTLLFDSTHFIIPDSSGLYDVFLAKYDSNGSVKWVKTISGPRSESGLALAITYEGNLFVLGSSFNQNPAVIDFGNIQLSISDSLAGIIVSKLDTNIVMSSMPINETFPYAVIYPNPSNGMLHIEIGQNETASLVVFDLLSKEIFRRTFTRETIISTDHLRPGIYFCEISYPDEIIKRIRFVVD